MIDITKFARKLKENGILLSEDNKYFYIYCSDLNIPGSGKNQQIRIRKKDYYVDYFLPDDYSFKEICWGKTDKDAIENEKKVKEELKEGRLETAIALIFEMYRKDHGN
jgi:hypothetical protein